MSQSVIYEPTFKQHSNIKNDLSLKKDLRKALAKKRMVKVSFLDFWLWNNRFQENNAHREELAHLAVSDNSDLSEAEEFLSPKSDARHRRLSADSGEGNKGPEKR